MALHTIISLGSTYLSAGIHLSCEQDEMFYRFVHYSLDCHRHGQWGDLCDEDRLLNDDALESGGRLFSVYDLDDSLAHLGSKIYIITEYDRSSTTVLWPTEY